MLRAGIENERLDRPDFILDPVEQFDHGFFIPRVAGNSLGLTAVSLYLGDQLAKRQDLPAGWDGDQPFAGKPPRDCPAEGIARSHDDGSTRHTGLRTESRCRPWAHRNSTGLRVSGGC